MRRRILVLGVLSMALPAAAGSRGGARPLAAPRLVGRYSFIDGQPVLYRPHRHPLGYAVLKVFESPREQARHCYDSAVTDGSLGTTPPSFEELWRRAGRDREGAS